MRITQWRFKMPNMANITVKNAANADVVYVAGSPSSGDRVPARWKQNAAGVSWATRPDFTIVTRSNGRNTTRIVEGMFKFPILDVDGNITDVIPGSFTFTGVNSVDAAKINDAFVQFGNLIASALVRAVAQEGFAPT